MSLWAVTCLFNPRRYRRRVENFHRFRARLGVPLVAVELCFDGHRDLGEGDAEVLVRIDGGDVMWQKERLLNIGLRHLPPACSAVALLDCDVLFEDPDWSGATLAALEVDPVAQLFSFVHYLPREGEPAARGRTAATPRHTGVAWAVRQQGIPPQACLGTQPDGGRGVYASGFAWAMRRDLLDRHGLFDANIAGGGDTAMASACWGAFEAVERRHAMTPPHRRRYRRWADAWHAEVGGRVAVLQGGLLHLWHGELEQRMAGQRHHRLAGHGYDPDADIALADSGCWRWASDKPGLHRFLGEYFAERREDG